MLPPLELRKYLVRLYDSGALGRQLVGLICKIYILLQKIKRAKPFQDTNALGLVFQKNKAAFIGMPKAATQTFNQSFYLNKEERQKYNVDLIQEWPVSHTIFRDYPDFFTFTFVRNPWARALSCYNSKIADPHPLKTARILSLYQNLSHDMSFLEFTRWLLTEEGSDNTADRHWLSQHHFITDKNGKIKCNHIGRFESMETELPILLDKIGIEKHSLNFQGYRSGASDYHNFYCDEARINITKRYARDIELFDYTF